MSLVVQIASVSDRDHLVAEIWQEDEMMAEVWRDGDGDLRIEILAGAKKKCWSLDLSAWMTALEEARNRLGSS